MPRAPITSPKTSEGRMTDDQRKQILRLVDDRLSRINPTSAVAQRVIKRGGEFGNGVQELFRGLSTTDQFGNEEVESSYGYLSGYTKPRWLTEQANVLRTLFSGLGFVNMDYQAKIERGEIALPEWADGWFAIPNWIKNPKIFGKSYAQAVQTIFNKIKGQRGKLYNYREGQITDRHFRQSGRALHFWEQLSRDQGNPDILIVPAQFGLRHSGRSVRRARVVMADTAGEFGLGAFAVGAMLLTHPERLKHVDDLWIYFAGDEVDDSGSDVRFGNVPCFDFRGGGVRFDSRSCDVALGYCGSASGFLPQ